MTPSEFNSSQQTRTNDIPLDNVKQAETDLSTAPTMESEDSTLHSRQRPPRGMAWTLLLATVAVCLGSALLCLSAGLGIASSLLTLFPWLCIIFLLWRAVPEYPHAAFGWANVVTTIRAVYTVLLAGLIPAAELLTTSATSHWLWLIALGTVLVLSLDGLDGYLARKSGLSSELGARFDMEIDSLLALVISLLIWRSGEIGIWILGLGIMRYAFVTASIFLKPLQAELFASMRRKTVCVIQLGSLCAILSPAIQAPLSIAVGMFALVCLSASFARDIVWLYSNNPS